MPCCCIAPLDHFAVAIDGDVSRRQRWPHNALSVWLSTGQAVARGVLGALESVVAWKRSVTGNCTARVRIVSVSGEGEKRFRQQPVCHCAIQGCGVEALSAVGRSCGAMSVDVQVRRQEAAESGTCWRGDCANSIGLCVV